MRLRFISNDGAQHELNLTTKEVRVTVTDEADGEHEILIVQDSDLGEVRVAVEDEIVWSGLGF